MTRRIKPKTNRVTLSLTDAAIRAIDTHGAKECRTMSAQVEYMSLNWNAHPISVGAPPTKPVTPLRHEKDNPHPLFEEGDTSEWAQDFAPVQLVDNERGKFDLYKLVENDYVQHDIADRNGVRGLMPAGRGIGGVAVRNKACNYQTVALATEAKLWEFVARHPRRFDLPEDEG